MTISTTPLNSKVSALLQVETVLVYENKTSVKKDGIPVKEGRDVWWEDSVAKQSSSCDVEWVDAEDPLFLLYTSGSTGKILDTLLYVIVE